HADYVSGARDLAKRTRSQLLLSGEGGPDWQYAFAAESKARVIHDGDFIRVGPVELRVLHTPGHTPEHLTFVVTDMATSRHAMGAVTGDFIFVGDVGRPDLLERAAGVAGTMEANAKQLFASLRRFAANEPDYLQIWPGHGAGSACGKALGAVPSSTLGYEKLSNWAFQARDEAAFVAEVLTSQSDPPPYFAVMKRVNRDGPATSSTSALPRQEAASLPNVITQGALILDLRPTAQYGRGSVPGTINLPLNVDFVSRAGWLVAYDRDVYLISGDDDDTVAQAARRELALIGIDRVRGWFGPDAIERIPAVERQKIPVVDVTDVAQRVRAGDAMIIDVRNADEWEAGHIEGAVHVPLGKLAEYAAQAPQNHRQLVLHCATGGRSAIGASVLRANGLANVANMEGGFRAWSDAGLPTTAGA
ncbi:MAG TPA: rhodanese-like domain-containing protein, partial [Gemmatimonadaceae bacterium]|nr:rhodanese-like domain-containing protein [Gemmatimonadaceae bacterium]